MAAFRDSLTCCFVTGLVLAVPAYGQDDAAPEQVAWTLDADSWTRSGNTYMISGLVIEGDGGGILIEADEAVTTSLQFNDRWELTGSIHMAIGTARVLAESAIFEFEDGELVSGELSGDPATFEETEPEGAGPVRGEASRVVYDSGAGTVQMQGRAVFTLGPNSASGCDFVYQLDGGSLDSGSSECGVPLSVIYVPSGERSNEDDSPDEAPADDAAPGEESSPNESPPAP